MHVAAGPRILNSYNGSPTPTPIAPRHVAAGPRILNSYNPNKYGATKLDVAAGPRILNSYN